MLKNLIIFSFFLLTVVLAVAQSPSHNLQTAIELLNKNLEEEALLHLHECIRQDPEKVEALFLRARIFNNQKEFLKALTDYNALLSLDPENKEARYNRAMVLYQVERYNQALNDFEKCQELPSKETNTAYFKIDPLNNKASGISTLNRMEADLWNQIGLCYYELDQTDEALRAFNEGLDLETDNPDILINRALTYEKTNQYELAKKDYERVLQTQPDHEIASINHLRLQTNAEKMHALTTYISEHPDRYVGYTERGLVFYDNKDYKNAEKDFAQAYQKDPNNIEIQLNLALTKLKLDKLNEAELLLLNIADNEAHKEKAYFNLGNIKFKQHNFDEAISYYTLAIIRNGNNPNYYYNRGLAYFENNMIDKACEDMKNAQRINPETGKEFTSKYCP